jgi:micrococcal nuclease
MRRVLATVALLVGLAGCQSAASPGPATPALGVDGRGSMVRVVDGDTIVVRLAGREERVRLIGIDTPESVKPGSPVECFGKEASGHLASLLPEGTVVRLKGDVEQRDRYGRLLAYVYRDADGLFVNAVMARDGFAEPLTVPPNVAHTAELATAARSARESGRGLWAACPAPGAPPTRAPPG